MTFPKVFYPKTSLKRKILDFKDDVKEVIKPHCNEKFWIEWYGAYEIDPTKLVIWICVESDQMKLRLIADTDLETEFRMLLNKHEYPSQARSKVAIGFESQETVNRESNGNWQTHFK